MGMRQTSGPAGGTEDGDDGPSCLTETLHSLSRSDWSKEAAGFEADKAAICCRALLRILRAMASSGAGTGKQRRERWSLRPTRAGWLKLSEEPDRGRYGLIRLQY